MVTVLEHHDVSSIASQGVNQLFSCVHRPPSPLTSLSTATTRQLCNPASEMRGHLQVETNTGASDGRIATGCRWEIAIQGRHRRRKQTASATQKAITTPGLPDDKAP